MAAVVCDVHHCLHRRHRRIAPALHRWASARRVSMVPAPRRRYRHLNHHHPRPHAEQTGLPLLYYYANRSYRTHSRHGRSPAIRAAQPSFLHLNHPLGTQTRSFLRATATPPIPAFLASPPQVSPPSLPTVHPLPLAPIERSRRYQTTH